MGIAFDESAVCRYSDELLTHGSKGATWDLIGEKLDLNGDTARTKWTKMGRIFNRRKPSYETKHPVRLASKRPLPIPIAISLGANNELRKARRCNPQWTGGLALSCGRKENTASQAGSKAEGENLLALPMLIVVLLSACH